MDVCLLVGGILGGTIGYRIGIKNKVSQSQKGRNNASQVQIGSVIKNGDSESRR